jgi:hypothetical protein
MGTDDESLIRLVVTRSEVDMVQIKQAFLANYHKTLAKMISVRASLNGCRPIDVYAASPSHGCRARPAAITSASCWSLSVVISCCGISSANKVFASAKIYVKLRVILPNQLLNYNNNKRTKK